MSSSKKIIVILIGLFGFLLIAEFLYYQHSSALQEKQIWQLYNEIAERDSLIKVTDDGYEKLAIEFRESKILQKDLEKEKGKLASVIRKKNLKIRSLTSLTLKPDTVKITIPGEEVIVADSTRKVRVEFSRKIGRMKVWGFTTTPPPVAHLNFFEDPLELYIILTQDKDKRWRTYVDSPITVSELQTKVVPYNPSFWEQVGFKAGVGYGSKRLMGIVGLEFKRTDFFMFADNHGTAFGITRAWRFR